MPAVDKLEPPGRADVPGPDHVQAGGVSRSRSLFDREILAHAAVGAVAKFDPRVTRPGGPPAGVSLPRITEGRR